MATENLSTKNGETQAKTEGLADLLDRALWPITAFIKELEAQSDYGAQEELDRLLSFLVPITDTVKENLEVLGDVLKQSIGYIEIEPTKKFRIFGGFRREDFGKAFIVAREPQAAAEGGV